MKKVTNSNLNETYFVETLDNGLTVYLMPKKQFNQIYGIFMTHFGSNYLTFKPANHPDYITVPAGVAHFLEHKMFENGDNLIIDEAFTRLGSDCNAFTTNDQTCYLFKGIESPLDNVQLLLDFVQNPGYTSESIEKEKGIIEQEIQMYKDKPDTALILHIIENMYFKNNIRIDVGGTVESIKQITKSDLDECYQTFYHPSNMVLVVTGQFDENSLIKMIVENQKNKNFVKTFKPEVLIDYEDEQVKTPYSTSMMDISIPKVAVGIKFSTLNNNKPNYEITTYKNNIILDYLIDIYFGESSNAYYELLNKQIINNTFYCESAFEKDYAYLCLCVTTSKVDEFINSIKAIFKNIHDLPIDETIFKRYQKVYQSKLLRSYDDIVSLAHNLVYVDEHGLTLFEGDEIKLNITVDDLNDFKVRFVENAITTHVIKPLKAQ